MTKELKLWEFARQVEARDFRLRLIGNTLIAMRKLLEGGKPCQRTKG